MSDITTSLTGTRIRVDRFYGMAENDADLKGRFGTINSSSPDSDGDVNVTLDGVTGSYYAKAWTVLGEGDTLPESNPIGQTETVERTSAEQQLEDLIDAVYKAAEDHGYRQHLAGVFESAGIPLRATDRRLTLCGQRVVSPYDLTPVNDALDRLTIGEKAPDTEVSVSRVLAEFVVSVPWPEVEGEHHDCYDLTNEMADDYSQIPDEVLTKAALAVGLRGVPATLRSHLTDQRKIAPSYGASVACNLCG